ncbi:MAG: DUF3048 domain-containing protein [Actinomycetota bacterium]
MPPQLAPSPMPPSQRRARPRSRRGARSGRTLALTITLALALVAAACGGGEDPSDLTFTDESTTTTTEATTTSTTASADADTDGVEEAEVPRFGPADGSTADGTPTTVGSGLPPAVVGLPESGGDPDGIYRGTIGTLDPDEVVAAGAVSPPRTEAGTLPLTGQAGTVPDRPAAVVKIDNGSAADPHAGLNAADIVIEEEVEGGVTRFAAVFHSTPSIVGPVRSGRTTDIALISGLGSPILLYSGANAITQGILVDQDDIELRAEGWSSGFWRDGNRRAPSNLFTDTTPHWASSASPPPPAQFHYRQPGDPVDGASVEEVSIAYPSSVARWVWDGSVWLRWQRGAEHRLASGQQVTAANVVVIEAEEVDTGMVDASGGAVPEFVFVGSGRATVFTEGRRIEGTWTRPTLDSVATLTVGPGRPIELTPGRTWIQLVEAGANAFSSS